LLSALSLDVLLQPVIESMQALNYFNADAAVVVRTLPWANFLPLRIGLSVA
jgi:hypothetical protein